MHVNAEGGGKRAPLLDAAVAGYLARQRVGHLATADAAGNPHVVPVCFALIGAVIYVPIDRKPKRASPRDLRRVRNVLENPRAALVADTYDEDWTRLGYVLVRGTARLVEEEEEHARALAALRQKYPPYQSMDLSGRPVLALAIEQVTAWGHLAAHSHASPRKHG